MQDKLTGALIGLARATDNNEHLVEESTNQLFLEGLFATLTNFNFDGEAFHRLLGRVDAQKRRLGPTLPAFVSDNVLAFLVEKFGIAAITTSEEDLKVLLGEG